MKAPILLALLGLATAQAAEPTGTLTLACQGTRTTRGSPNTGGPFDEQVSMGIIVNFTDRTINAIGRMF